MNLSAYDIIPEKVNKNKTWVIPENKILLSREISRRKYVCLSKKYNPSINSTDYFIIVLDDIPNTESYSHIRIDNYGRVKIRLGSIWEESTLKNITKEQNINITHVESADDGDIYQLDI